MQLRIINARNPQGEILSIVHYSVFTSDLPLTTNSLFATYRDSTVILGKFSIKLNEINKKCPSLNYFTNFAYLNVSTKRTVRWILSKEMNLVDK